MFNLISEWETKARFSIKIRSCGNWSDLVMEKHYQRALAYCDCISTFTDGDRWDVYDRLQQEMLADQ
jgi:hypothetical protein